MEEYPKFIDIELNIGCNLKCGFCPYKEYHKKPEFMEFSLFARILFQIYWKPSLKLCQRGEPLLSPILIPAIKRAKQRGLNVVINTNGILLDKYGMDLIKSRLDVLYLSDYGKKLQFRNGCYFSALNQLNGNSTKFVVKTTDLEKWKGIADEIITPKFYNYKDKNSDYTPLPSWKCKDLFEKFIIEPNGDVRCCCGDIHPEKYVGNIKEKTIKEIWDDIHEGYCRIHESGHSHLLDMCVKCPVRKEEINRTYQMIKILKKEVNEWTK